MEQVFQVQKVLLVSLVTLGFQEQTAVLAALDLQVLKEILVAKEVQVFLGLQDLKAKWETWESQDHQGRKVYQECRVYQDPQDSQDHLVTKDPKVSQVLLASDRLD